MLNPVCVAVIMVLGLAMPIEAQQSKTLSASEVWDRFKLVCENALSDPNGYLASIDRPGPFGERAVSISPDGNVVSVYRREANSYEEVEFHVIGERQVFDCSVIGEFYDVETSSLAQQFEEMISSSGGMKISGGHAPQDYVEEGGLYSENDIFLYAIDGVWPQPGIIVIAHVIAGELQIYVHQTIN